MWSLNKILLLVGVVLAVWYGFRLWQRLQARPDGARRDRVARGAPPPGASARGQRRADPVEDMRACPVCGVFVAATAGPCERADCPRR